MALHTLTAPWPTVIFSPRRIGHVNMSVSDLERSAAFYQDVCGVERVFNEVPAEMWFLSNGNSHHDIALRQASMKAFPLRDGTFEEARKGADRAHINHIAFEMEDEASLVAGIERAKSLGFPVHGLRDHLISRSIYIPEPNGLEVEVYVDSTPEWRALYKSLEGGLLSAPWEPGEDGAPSTAHNYSDGRDFQPPPEALAQPLRTTSATVVVLDLVASIDYYEQVIGLHVIESDTGAGGWAILGGTLGQADLLLLEQRREHTTGLHHFNLGLPSEEDLDASIERLQAANVPVVKTIEHALKKGIVIADPDGVLVELSASRTPPNVTYASVVTPEVREFLI